ncbi:TIGR03862 family flavoprotein [Rhodobacterales bacterium]|nr:TIGR03862 family flavoprotein [Rhodobacterales bacterium]
MLDLLVLGAGPAGLYAAECAAERGLKVAIADRMASPARKFLMAGRGGLNLTHSEDLSLFLSRYREAEPFLRPMFEAFTPSDLRDWCHGLGQETFVGSSGRVFPCSMKASPLLRAWLRRLSAMGVELLAGRRFTGFAEDGAVLLQADSDDLENHTARAVLLALGGASWPKLGSDAAWVPVLEARGIAVSRLRPANCGFAVAWSPFVRERFSGTPLKRIALSFAGRTVPGEAVLSEKGLEGGAIYALSAEIREAIARDGEASLQVDLRPSMSVETLTAKLQKPRGKQSTATYLKKTLKLNPAELALLREAGPLPEDPAGIASRIKTLPITCIAPYDIDRAISSAGGIALEELGSDLMLKKLPGVFAAGEMLDWEAPTGGYLLQACFATGRSAADGICDYLDAGSERKDT